ncbi:MAG: TolC family protein [Sphingomonadales bacterium]|nr:TolC family protein [Sphingomonadales bacterium]
MWRLPVCKRFCIQPALAATLLIVSAQVRAEPGLPEAPEVAAALDGAPAVRAARARARAARAEADTLAAGPHEFTVSTSYLSRNVRGEGAASDGRFDEFEAQITRPVRLPGKARLDVRIGALGITAADNRAEDARHQAALLLAQGWWDWLGAAEQARIDSQAIANYETLLAGIRRRAALRDASQLEVDQAMAALGLARLASERSTGQERLARGRLAARFPGFRLPEMAPEIPRPEMPVPRLAVLHDRILGKSHEIIAAESEADRMRALADRVRRDRMADPTVGMRVFSERNGAEKGIGVLVSMPLGGGHRSALARRAGAEADAALAEATAAHLSVQETADADLTEAEFSLEVWDRAREGLNAQVAALNKMRRGQQAGEFDLSDVLLAERQVHDAFRSEAQARTDALRALTKIRIDAHELWIGDAEDNALPENLTN